MQIAKNVAQAINRNPGMELDLDWVGAAVVNRSATERRAATMVGRRTVKKDWQAAWLIQAIRCIDLTTLSGDDTPGNVQRLCAKAKQPVSSPLLAALGLSTPPHVGAVCVYHRYVSECVRLLVGTDIPVAAVSTGFPAGLSPFDERLTEIHRSVTDGAAEIDIVITRAHV